MSRSIEQNLEGLITIKVKVQPLRHKGTKKKEYEDCGLCEKLLRCTEKDGNRR